MPVNSTNRERALAAEWPGVGVPALVRTASSEAPALARPNAREWAGWKRLVAFAAFMTAAILCAQAAITLGLRRVATGDFGSSNRIVNGAINATIVITGSSRAQAHYDPRLIEAATGLSAYNLGRNGSQTDLQVAVLKTYLAHNAKPRLVIHNLDLFSLVTSHEIYDPVQYVPYLGEAPIYAAVRRVYPDAWKWKYVPLYGYAAVDLRFQWLRGFEGLAGVHRPENSFGGFVPRYSAWTGDFEKFRAANPHGARTSIERQGVRDLEELVGLCRSQDIPVMLVYSPEFVGIQRLETNRAAIFALFAMIGARYHVPIWDFSASPISADQHNFYNSQHLNAAGAELFSSELARRLAAHGPELSSLASDR